MASKHREQKIIASVPCPVCGARIGELCRQRATTLDRSLAQGGRPLLHTERRLEWERTKRGGAA